MTFYDDREAVLTELLVVQNKKISWLARRVGISRQTLTDYLRRRTKSVRPELMRDICGELGMQKVFWLQSMTELREADPHDITTG